MPAPGLEECRGCKSDGVSCEYVYVFVFNDGFRGCLFHAAQHAVALFNPRAPVALESSDAEKAREVLACAARCLGAPFVQSVSQAAP